MVKMEDVAKYAGVSKSTVSRVINNKTVSRNNYNRIIEAIEQLDYQPNKLAQSLTTRTTGLIGMMVYQPITTCLAKAVQGFEQAGLLSVLVVVEKDRASLHQASQKLRHYGCDLIAIQSLFHNGLFIHGQKNKLSELTNLLSCSAVRLRTHYLYLPFNERFND